MGWVDKDVVPEYFIAVFIFIQRCFASQGIDFGGESIKYKGEKAECNGKRLVSEVRRAVNSMFCQLSLSALGPGI